MDRRSWLWRRKSSEKSPTAETESSGSVSSHSERFSDDQTLSNHNIQSPEVTKAAPDDVHNDSVKTLSEKLTEALLNIHEKEDLVKQHGKVAEEAVSGWERAENEVSILKKQNEALIQKNLILEERVEHLDGALKECLRQLRQAREEKEEKMREWEPKEQLWELHAQLENAITYANTLAAKLEAAEKEKSILKLKLLSKVEELEVRSRERDLSTHAAENASKLHLDSIKRVAKLEAECRRLKAWARKATDVTVPSSIYVESFTDSQSDIGERIHIIEDDSSRMTHDQGRSSSSLMVPSVEIDDLMDDFLEMERLAAQPEDHSGAKKERNELEAMINKATELEDTLKKITAEKVSFEIAVSESEIQLKASEDQRKQTEMQLADLKSQLAQANEEKKEVEHIKEELNKLTKLLGEAEAKWRNIQDQLVEANEAKIIVELQLEEASLKKAESESQLKLMVLELETLEKEKNISREAVARCDILEAEISRMKSDAQFQRSAMIDEFRINQDKEMAVAAGKFAACQKTIASLGRQLKSLATIEDFLREE